jgi:hypothetical protein
MSEANDMLLPLAQREWAAPFDYDGLRRRALRRQRRQAVGQRLGGLALGLAGVAVLGLLALSSRERGAPAVPSFAEPPAAILTAAIDEVWLRDLPTEPAVARGAMRAPVTLLEDRIAWLDDSLSEAVQDAGLGADVPRLRAERERLVDALVRVRFAEHLSAEIN